MFQIHREKHAFLFFVVFFCQFSGLLTFSLFFRFFFPFCVRLKGLWDRGLVFFSLSMAGSIFLLDDYFICLLSVIQWIYLFILSEHQAVVFSSAHFLLSRKEKKGGGINDWQVNNKLKFTFQHHDLELIKFSNDVKETVIWGGSEMIWYLSNMMILQITVYHIIFRMFF